MAFSVKWDFIAIDSFSKVATKIAKKTDTLRKKIDHLRKRVRKATTSIKKDFKKMKTGLLASFAAMSAGIFKGGKTFMKFEDNLAELNAIVGPTAAELDDLSKSALSMGVDASRSGADVLTAFKLIASAKPELLTNIPALKGMTKEVLLLSNASGLSLADASNIAAQSLNIFGKEASMAGRFVDILAAGAKFGSSEIRDTGEAVLKSGAAAKIAGIGFQELNASIQILSSQGLKAEIAGTGLNAIFTKLAATGIPALDTKSKGLVTVLKTLGEAELTAKQMVTLFGLENIKTAQALIENADKITKMTKKLDASGIAAEQAKIRLATLSRKLERLGTIIERKVVKVFGDLAPIIDRNIEAFAAWIEAIKTEDVENFILLAKGILWVFGKIADAIGIAVDGLKMMGKLIGQVAGMLALGQFDIMKIDTSEIKKISSEMGTSVLDFLGLIDKVPAQLNIAGLIGGGAPVPVAANDAKFNGQVGINVNVNDPTQRATVNTEVEGMVKLNTGANIAGGR